MHKHDFADGDRKVVWAVLVNILLTIVQIIGGLVSGSLALIADAIHNLSDAMALVIAFGARKIARLPANEEMSFGYGRAELVAAIINYTTLIVIGCFLIYEAVWRFFEPLQVDGWIVVVLATVALIIDLITAGLTHKLAKHSMNIRAAFLHNLADALGSIGVILAGTLILLYDWRYIDPIITIAIAFYILWQALTEGLDVVRILMLATPKDIDRRELMESITSIDGVDSIQHIHVWQIEENRLSLEAHLTVSAREFSECEGLKTKIRKHLSETYNVQHSTLEIAVAVT